jgi:hypothetical protein
MDAIREQLERPLVAGAVGFVVGVFIGLVVLGWWLFPVRFTGASPEHLTDAAKREYMTMAIQAYTATGDAAAAQARFEALGEDAAQVLNEVASVPGGPSTEQVQAFAAAVAAGQVAAQPGQPGITAAPTMAATEAATGGGGIFSWLLPVLCVIVLLVAAAGIVYYIMRSRTVGGGGTAATPAMQAQQAARQAAWTDYAAAGAEPPMAQFMASYKIGDDLFDDSFSIDSPIGEFMGECGVGISETIGVGEPKKVTAFEVWLFDKNDIQTVTKVLMSAHAYEDDSTRQRLENKGEPVIAEPGTEVVLETQTLQMVARVVDMAYGDGALPPQSFFDRFIIELAIWSK